MLYSSKQSPTNILIDRCIPHRYSEWETKEEEGQKIPPKWYTTGVCACLSGPQACEKSDIVMGKSNKNK